MLQGEQNFAIFQLLHVFNKTWYISLIYTEETLVYISVNIYSGLQVLHLLIIVNMASLVQVIHKLALDPYTQNTCFYLHCTW